MTEESFKIVTPEMLEKFVVTDIECERDIDGKEVTFEKPEFAGIGVACTVDQDGIERDWLKERVFNYFGYMGQFPLIVGYNLILFDLPIIGGELLGPENQSASRFVYNNYKGRVVDLAQDFKEALGHRCKLENVTIPTLGETKIMDGKNAPNRLRNGKLLETITYCRDDNAKTKKLFLMAVRGEKLQYKTDSGIKNFTVQPKLR